MGRMVRSYTPSDSDEETKSKKKHRRKRTVSRSPHRDADRKKKRHHTSSRSRSSSPQRRKIKKESSPSRRHHHEDRARHKEKRKHRHRDRNEEEVRYDPNRPIKREPEEEAREQRRERQRNDDRRRENRRNRGGNPFQQDGEDYEYGQSSQDKKDVKPKDEPDFKLSGKLTEDTNTYRGVVIKYNQPPEARKPKKRWRLYPFKGEESLPILHIHRNSAYLIGRDRIVVDIPTDHPSCSKQHAVLQYRMVDFERDDGTVGRRVAPYIIDLGSSNGTYVNNQRIEAQHYVELFEKDVLKFGYSTREYVLLHEKTDTKGMNDEGKDSESD